MDELLGFFKKKKLDIKFKQAGEGHKLSEEKKQPVFIPKDKGRLKLYYNNCFIIIIN